MVLKTKQIAFFQQQLLSWFEKNGRKNLPWQGSNAYHVWISEIMLQQTQVSKVIDYFNQFITQFPTLKLLAQADIQQVLQLWSGLGYYNRARNLHKTALICHQFIDNELPVDLKLLMDLPGIGRTTAGAILSLASNLPFSILDGNVKRVMSRVFAVNAPKLSVLNNKLWDIVNQLVPDNDARNYNQALMDLGSKVCTRTKPFCTKCPFNEICRAKKDDQIELFPQSKKATKQVKVTFYALLIEDKEKIYLQQRDGQGIWPELWFLPVYDTERDRIQWLQNYGLINEEINQFSIKHILTHRIIDINVSHICTDSITIDDGKWLNLTDIKDIARPIALDKIIANQNITNSSS